MLDPENYERAVHCFLEEFAGDVEFMRASEPEKMPHLVAVLERVVSQIIGRPVELEGALVSYLRAHRFVHGNARADGHAVHLAINLVIAMPQADGFELRSGFKRFRSAAHFNP